MDISGIFLNILKSLNNLFFLERCYCIFANVSYNYFSFVYKNNISKNKTLLLFLRKQITCILFRAYYRMESFYFHSLVRIFCESKRNSECPGITMIWILCFIICVYVYNYNMSILVNLSGCQANVSF